MTYVYKPKPITEKQKECLTNIAEEIKKCTFKLDDALSDEDHKLLYNVLATHFESADIGLNSKQASKLITIGYMVANGSLSFLFEVLKAIEKLKTLSDQAVDEKKGEILLHHIMWNR